MSAPDQPMTARRQLRLAVLAALGTVSATLRMPGILPTPQNKLPALLVTTPSDSKQSTGPNQVSFTTTITVVIEGQVVGTTPEAAQDSIDALAYAVENAVLLDYATRSMIQQFTSVQTETDVKADGNNILAGFRMTITAETYEDFDPAAVPPAATTWPTANQSITAFECENMHLDLANVFDPSGTYPSPPFPDAVNPAPRTSGPDGRDEGALFIDLPQ